MGKPQNFLAARRHIGKWPTSIPTVNVGGEKGVQVDIKHLKALKRFYEPTKGQVKYTEASIKCVYDLLTANGYTQAALFLRKHYLQGRKQVEAQPVKHQRKVRQVLKEMPQHIRYD